jgi:hypothetical protein
MASESGTTDIEPLHFGGTKPPRRFLAQRYERQGRFCPWGSVAAFVCELMPFWQNETPLNMTLNQWLARTPKTRVHEEAPATRISARGRHGMPGSRPPRRRAGVFLAKQFPGETATESINSERGIFLQRCCAYSSAASALAASALRASGCGMTMML